MFGASGGGQKGWMSAVLSSAVQQKTWPGETVASFSDALTLSPPPNARIGVNQKTPIIPFKVVK